MHRLTEEESNMLRNALDTYVTIGLAQSHEVHAVRKQLQEKIGDMGFILFPETVPRLSDDEKKQLKELIKLNDEREVDDDFPISPGEDGVWVQTWEFIYKRDLDKELFAKLYPGETHPDDEEE